MKILQVGLGSMGKRRIRCLKTLGIAGGDVTGFDFREDRRKEAEEKYGVRTTDDVRKTGLGPFDLVIVSTPPDKHDEYIELAIKNKKPVFVEASVTIGRLKELNELAKKEKVLVAPSCTLRYHAAIKEIIRIVKGGDYGKLTNFTYHSGQYLPDWHPYEDVKKYYVSNKITGAAREIVPFEMAWLTAVAGFPEKVTGFCGKTMDVGADIDDTYVIAMKFGNQVYGILNVDVVSRYATRSLILNMEYGQVLWRWDENIVRIYDARKKSWDDHSYALGEAAKGYNKNITEDMYVDELNAFIKAATGGEKFPNDLDEDIAALEILPEIEKNGR